MKLETCEQMIQSWLLNCKLCEIAQTNWKISPLYLKTISQLDMENVQKFMDEIKGINHPGMSDVFGKNNAEQFVKQCEIDIVGIKFDNGDVDTVYFADSAFHKDGLGYNDTTRAVVMKIARASAISHIVFGDKATTKVIFASPKCTPAPKKKIEDAIKSILPTVKKFYPNVVVELYFNEDFARELFVPLIQNMDDLYDDNDLFMRSLYLARIAQNYLPQAQQTSKTSSKKSFKSAPNCPKTTVAVPTIEFVPSKVEDFKTQLLQSKRAEITWIYSDGTQVDKVWDASNVSATTDVKINIQSRPEWRNRDVSGLVEVKVKVM